MSTFISQFSDSEIKVRHKEPFLTAGLNQKAAAVTPAGIYRGFRLVLNAGQVVTVESDPKHSDHVAAYETADGYSVRLRRSGNFTIDLAAFASSTVVLAIFSEYLLSQDTTAVIRAYTVAEYNAAPEKSELVVMGTVDVPAGAIIDSGIRPERRTSAWFSAAPDAGPWRQFVQNGSFDIADVGTLPVVISDDDPLPGWDTYTGVLNNNTSWGIAQTAARSGLNELRLILTGGAPQTASLYVAGQARARAGKFVRVSVWVRSDTVAPGPGVSGHLGLRVSWYDGNYGAIGSQYVDDLSIVGTTGYTEITTILKAPAGTEYIEVSLNFDDDSASSTGSYYFDDCRIWIEGDDPAEDDNRENEPFVSATKTYALDIVEAPPFTTMNDLVNHIWRVRSDGVLGGEHALLASCRDAVTPFLLRFLEGSLDLGGFLKNLGGDRTAFAADVIKPRIEMPVAANAVAAFTLLAEFQGTVNGPIRIYLTEARGIYGPSLWITTNARFGGTNWVRDVSGSSGIFGVYQGGISVGHYESTAASPWTDASWYNYFISAAAPGSSQEYSLFSLNNPQLQFHTVSSESNPTVAEQQITAPLANTTYALSMVRAWAHIITGPSAAPFLDDAFNIDDATLGYVGLSLHVDFLTPLNAPGSANDFYAIAGCGDNEADKFLSPYNLLNSGFDLDVYDSAGSKIDLSTVPTELMFVVFGRQNS